MESIVNLGLGITRRVGQADGEITLKFNEVMNNQPFTVGNDGIDAEDFYSFF